MNIDFCCMKWDKLSILLEMDSSNDQIFYSDNNGKIISHFDWIQDITNITNNNIRNLQKKNEAHYCYNFNRNNIKRNAPIIYDRFNFIIESIIGDQSYEDKYSFVDCPNEYDQLHNFSFYIILSPLKINKIIQLWKESNYFEEIEKIYLQPHLDALNRIKSYDEFKIYIFAWINLLEQINMNPENGLLIGW